MDIEGYRKFRKYMNNKIEDDRIVDDEIQILLRLEKEFNINLDDFIPYNGNYSVCAKLDAIIGDLKYDERIFFIINRYMRFKLEEKS